MSEQYSKWGPKFNHYIKDSSAREEKAFSDYLESREITSVAHGGLLPLSILQTLLVIGKNIDQTSHQRCGTFLPVLLTTLRQYKELNPSSIFEYYYGYLCIQHVIHTICIAILIEMDVLEDLVENRRRGPGCAAWGFIEALADRALCFITQTPLSTNLARVPTYFGVESLGMDIFPRVGGLNSEDLDFLLMTLWNDRCRLTTLIKRRMLPGLSALLFTTGHMMLCLGASRSAERWVPLHDLISRLILFGSQHILEEQRLLQFVWAQRVDLGLMQDSSVDEKDSRAVVRAYMDMFRPNSNEDRRSLSETMWMEPLSILFRFACSHASTMAPNLLPEIQLVAIERLWLELDEERGGYVTVAQSDQIIIYVLDIFQVMWSLQCSLTAPTTKAILAGICLRVDLFDLFGRIMLLALRDDSRPEILKQLRETFHDFFDISEEALSSYSKHSLKADSIHWGKVNDHLTMRKFGMTQDGTSTCILEAMQLWEPFYHPPTHRVWAKVCTNPRCPGFVMMGLSDIAGGCGGCSEILYCSKRCQQMHRFFTVMKRHSSRPGPTGSSCLTCKHRRKKCDKTRPACERCVTGGFTCLGYGHLDHQPPSLSLEEMAGETSNTDNTQPSTLLDFSTGQFDPGFPANESTSVLLATLDRYSVGSSSGLAELAPPIDSGKDIGIDTNTIVLSHDAPRTGPLPVQCEPQIYSTGYSSVYALAARQSQSRCESCSRRMSSPAWRLHGSAAPWACPHHLSPDPNNASDIVDFILSAYDQMITLVYFKPPSRQATRTRNSLIKRIEKSDTARLTVFIGYQLLQSLIKGGSAEKISFYTNWLGQLEQQSSASTSDPNLTPAEYQNRLSSMLELAFLRFGLANQSTSVYRLLLDCAPVFLQMALMEGAWQPNSSSVSVARLFASTRHELVQFVLQDSLCSMLYALPQAVDYDTSIQPSGEERHIVEWVYGCPAEFQVALVDMNAHIHHKPGKNIDWQLMEQSLKSWKPTALDREGESWKAVARLAVHESWRHTLLIYLYMAVCGATSADARVQASVRQVFRLTSAVKPPEVPTINIHLFVQYIVAGACARDEKRRAIAREKLRFEFIKELMILRGSNFVPVLDHLWHGAAANGRPIRWSDFVKSRQTAHPILI